jgi:hypothetical protein
MKRILTTLSQKWPEYLIESFVIVASILGAFALDNWNEQRKEKVEANTLYDQLLLDYNDNLNQLNQKIELHRSCVSAGFSLLEAMDHQDGNLDSILTFLSLQTIDVTFDPINNDLGSSGKIDLITNPELNRLISNWNSDLAALREMELMWQGIVYGQLLNLYMEMGIERDVQSKFWDVDNIHTDWLLNQKILEFRPMTKSRSLPKLQDILSNRQLESIIAYGVIMNQGAIEQSLALRTRMEKTIALIKNELNK